MTTDVIDYDKQVGKSWQIGTVVEGHTNNLYKDDHFLLHAWHSSFGTMFGIWQVEKP